MKKIFFILGILISGSTSHSQSIYTGYHTVFVENFDYPGTTGFSGSALLASTIPASTGTPNVMGHRFSDNWYLIQGYTCYGGDAAYLPDNVTMSQPGIIRLTEHAVTPFVVLTPGCSFPSIIYNHTSGVISSNQRFGYGIIEARIRLTNDIVGVVNPETGTKEFATSAFWTNHGFNGQNTELDIFDASEDNYLIHRVVDYESPTNINESPYEGVSSLLPTGEFLSDNFHVYSCVWTPTNASYFLDGNLLASIDYTAARTYPGIYSSLVSDARLYNLSINLTASKYSSDGFFMEIDWIKAWEMDCDNDDYHVEDHLTQSTVNPGITKYASIESGPSGTGIVQTQQTLPTVFEAPSTTLNPNFVSDQSTLIWNTKQYDGGIMAPAIANAYFEIVPINCDNGQGCALGPISGPSIICFNPDPSEIFTFYDATPGGVWESDNPNIAIDPTTGIILANTITTLTGTVNISYMLNGCSVTMKVKIIDCALGERMRATTKVTSIKKTSDITIFPNPTQSIITINYTCQSVGRLEINIKDVAGQVMYDQSINCNDSGNIEQNVDMTSFAPGVYFVNLTLNDQHTVKKIVKL